MKKKKKKSNNSINNNKNRKLSDSVNKSILCEGHFYSHTILGSRAIDLRLDLVCFSI